jgi:hypothetical protein
MNQTYQVTKKARIKSQGGNIVMPGGVLQTITPPKIVDGQDDTIMVRYQGKGRDGEVKTGAKFSVKVTNLVRHGERSD